MHHCKCDIAMHRMRYEDAVALLIRCGIRPATRIEDLFSHYFFNLPGAINPHCENWLPNAATPHAMRKHRETWFAHMTRLRSIARHGNFTSTDMIGIDRKRYETCSSHC